MKKFFLSLLLWCGLVAGAAADETGIPWDKFPAEKLSDVASLQTGAKLFANYCLNCHSAAYMRYNRMHDIDLSDDQIKKNLLFANEKVGDLMKVSLDAKQAKQWFGVVPPDLSVITRSRSGPNGSGADYLYTYLRSFYRDDSRPTGWNNLAFPGVAMPNVLWELQGQRGAKPPVEEKDPHEPGKTVHRFGGFEQITPGALNSAQFDDQVADLVAYLQWMSEPAYGQRIRIGVWVLLFMCLVVAITWRLNAAYWKDLK